MQEKPHPEGPTFTHTPETRKEACTGPDAGHLGRKFLDPGCLEHRIRKERIWSGHILWPHGPLTWRRPRAGLSKVWGPRQALLPMYKPSTTKMSSIVQMK